MHGDGSQNRQRNRRRAGAAPAGICDLKCRVAGERGRSQPGAADVGRAAVSDAERGGVAGQGGGLAVRADDRPRAVAGRPAAAAARRAQRGVDAGGIECLQRRRCRLRSARDREEGPVRWCCGKRGVRGWTLYLIQAGGPVTNHKKLTSAAVRVLRANTSARVPQQSHACVHTSLAPGPRHSQDGQLRGRVTGPCVDVGDRQRELTHQVGVEARDADVGAARARHSEAGGPGRLVDVGLAGAWWWVGVAPRACVTVARAGRAACPLPAASSRAAAPHGQRQATTAGSQCARRRLTRNGPQVRARHGGAAAARRAERNGDVSSDRRLDGGSGVDGPSNGRLWRRPVVPA